MNNPEQISLVAAAVAMVALMNWLAGDRSFRGGVLLIRQGSAWIACRWMGLALWLVSVITPVQADLRLEVAGLTGAVMLLIGTARRTLNKRTSDKSMSTTPTLSPAVDTAKSFHQ